MRLEAIAALIVIFAGCSSGSGDTQNVGDAGLDSAGGAGGRDGGNSAGAAGHSPPDVACGPGLTCSGGDDCCIPFDPTLPVRCAGECSFNSETAISCLGRADCGGNACCGSALFGFECVNAPTCPGTDKQLCRENSECESQQCNPQTDNGVELGVCVPA